MKPLFFLILVPIFAFCAEADILLESKKEIINLNQKHAQEKSKANQYNWLSDITLQSTISKDEEDTQTSNFSLSLSQDIYRFGGITSQIEYAKELQKMELLGVRIEMREQLVSLYGYYLDAMANEVALEQNGLNIQNAQIEIKNKTSQYKEGEIDISDLNNAIMSKNALADSKKELELSKIKNLNELKKLTSHEYSQIVLPHMQLPSKNLFLEKSMEILYADTDVKVKNSLYQVKKSDFLPSLSVEANYGYKDTTLVTGEDYYSYGLKLSMPLSYTASNQIEQTRLDYLLSKQEVIDKKIELEMEYQNALATIQSYEQRIALAKEDIKLYETLLDVSLQEYEAGYKSQEDVNTLKNSKMVRELDIKTYRLQIQKEILDLYFMCI